MVRQCSNHMRNTALPVRKLNKTKENVALDILQTTDTSIMNHAMNHAQKQNQLLSYLNLSMVAGRQ